MHDLRDQSARLHTLHRQMCGRVMGSEDTAFLMVVALVANGHVLLQGAPGIGKTALASALAQSIHGSFKRIQFTPDLLPSDILGYSMYHQPSGEFRFIQGPVFGNILLADEINRTNPRIQSALLECMNEHQVTVDGITRPLNRPFLVIATQNNVFASGTFPLPEPQLDRFLLSLDMEMPARETREQILLAHAGGLESAPLSPVLSGEEVAAIQESACAIPVSEAISRYIVALCEATWDHDSIRDGASTRASIAVMRAAQAVAFIEQHPAVHPDDVKRILAPTLGHRLVPKTRGHLNTKAVHSALADILANTPVS